jgi:hypothetical protein
MIRRIYLLYVRLICRNEMAIGIDRRAMTVLGVSPGFCLESMAEVRHESSKLK